MVTLVVESYDPAIQFFVEKLGFDLVEDSPALTNDGHPKRWVIVRPPGGQTGILLAQADGVDQASIVGSQVAGRVGFFFASMTSTGPTAEWRQLVSSSLTLPAPNHTEGSRCFLTLQAIVGT